MKQYKGGFTCLHCKIEKTIDNHKWDWMSINKFDTCTSNIPATPCGKQETAKEQNMFDCMEHHDERSYLAGRLSNLNWSKFQDGRKHFKLEQDIPNTVEKAIEKIKAGIYQLKDKKDRGVYDSWVHSIIWRAPDEKPDQDGFDAFAKKLENARTLAADEIAIGLPREGLEALRKFESTKVN